MITFCTARTSLLAAVLLLSAGCSREQQDWRSAEGADTSEAFAHFLEQHPTSELANQARLRIAQLGEESDWHRTDGIATIEAYRQFLAQHPNGKWAEEARIRIEGFSLGSAPRTAQAPANVGAKRTGVNALQLATGVANPLPAATPAPAARGPGSPECPDGRGDASGAAAPPLRTATRRLASATGYGVQLGAFGSQAGADREWQRLQGRFGSQLGGPRPAHRGRQCRRWRAALSATGPGERRGAGARPVRCAEGTVAGLRTRHPALIALRKGPSVFTDGPRPSEALTAALGSKVTIRVTRHARPDQR